MAFENDTNHGRVQKMIDTLSLIQKSAASNRAGTEALQAMMRPLIEALTEADIVGAVEAAPKRKMKASAILTAGERAALHLADGASMRELTAALLARLEANDARLAAADEDD